MAVSAANARERLRAEGLRVVRGGRVLFEALSFSADAGAYVEIRGANGAGKTSLLRALAGFLKPAAGSIAFPGASEPALALHFVGHQNGLKPNASVRAHLRYWAGLFGGQASEDYVLKLLALTRLADAPARVLSQGQARRLTLARLVIAPRNVWLLDEPAAALDADARVVLAELIASHRAQGGIVLAAVHEPLGPAATQTLTIGGAP